MVSSSLLDPSAFLGEPHDGRRDANAFVGEARFDGCVTVTAWRRTDAAALLPPELVLAPRVRDTREAHPVMTLFGTQWDGVMRFAGLAWPSGPPYHEVGVAVPFVTRRDGHALHLYMARMYASYPPAVWAGNAYFGFSKELAQVRWDGAHCVVTRRTGEPLVLAEVEGGAEAVAPGMFERVRVLFDLPVFGRRGDGSLACSRFDWDAGGALVRPAHALVCHAPSGDGREVLRSRDAVADATFSVRGIRWRLSWPGHCAG